MGRYMMIVRPGKYMIEMHSRLIERLKAHDVAGAKKTLQKELISGKAIVMDRIMQEEAGSWHIGTGRSK